MLSPLSEILLYKFLPFWFIQFSSDMFRRITVVPAGSPSPGEDVTVYVWHKPTDLAHYFSFCSCIYFCLDDPFNCIHYINSPDKFPFFWLCSSGLIAILLVLSTVNLFMTVSFSPDITPSGWLGSKHQWTKYHSASDLYSLMLWFVSL